MLFFSTSKKYENINLKQAVLSGLAPDKTLYLPNQIRPLPPTFFENIINRKLVRNFKFYFKLLFF